MFARCRNVGMLLAVLLSASFAQAGEGRLVQQVYAVSDIILLPDKDSGAKPNKEQLIKIITETIAPYSWSEKGGRGTIDYHPLTKALVVNQTPDVQDQIQDLLAAQRRLQEMEVSFEVKFVAVRVELFKDLKRQGLLGKPCKKTQARDNVTFLDDAGARRFIEAIQSDAYTNVTQAPKMTTFSGKKTEFNAVEKRKFVTGVEVVYRDNDLQYQKKTEVIPLGVQLSLQPIISADRRSIHVHLDAKINDLVSGGVPSRQVRTRIEPRQEESQDIVPVVFNQSIQEPRVNKQHLKRTLTIPDGNTVVVTGRTKQLISATACEVPILGQMPVVGALFRNIDYHCETLQFLVLVTPRIVVRQEKEEKQPHKAAGASDTHYWRPDKAVNNDYRTLVLGAFREQDPHCSKTPDEGRILRALPPVKRLAGVYEESRDNVQIVTERIVDKVDPQRFFPLVGPAQLHHCQWKCTVYYNETITCNYPFSFQWSRICTHVVYIDSDHLHLVAKDTPRTASPANPSDW